MALNLNELPTRLRDRILAALATEDTQTASARRSASAAPDTAPKPLEIRVGKRIRQSQKPRMNKLEAEWHGILVASGWMTNIRSQAKRYELGTGIWYKPDFTGNDTRDGLETAYEVKGPHAFRGGFENLKVAARAWPEIKWILVWKDKSGEWRQQKILP